MVCGVPKLSPHLNVLRPHSAPSIRTLHSTAPCVRTRTPSFSTGNTRSKSLRGARSIPLFQNSKFPLSSRKPPERFQRYKHVYSQKSFPLFDSGKSYNHPCFITPTGKDIKHEMVPWFGTHERFSFDVFSQVERFWPLEPVTSSFGKRKTYHFDSRTGELHTYTSHPSDEGRGHLLDSSRTA